MKKNYIAPATKIVNIHIQRLLGVNSGQLSGRSADVEGGEYTNALGRRSTIWDDDDEEEE